MADLARWQAEGYAVVLCFVGLDDASNLAEPFRRLAVYHDGRPTELAPRLPAWFERVIEALG